MLTHSTRPIWISCLKQVVHSCLFFLIVSNAHAKAGDRELIDTFYAHLTEEGKAQLGVSAEDLDPEGYAIRDRLLRPYLDKVPPQPKAVVEGKAERAFEERGEAIERLMDNEVHLLGATPWQEVGDPVDWFHAPEDDLQWTTHLNRHYFLISLAFAGRQSGDLVYSDKVVLTLLDWIEKMPVESDRLVWKETEWSLRYKDSTDSPQSKEGYFPDYVDGPWISLSAAARVQFWTELFQILDTSASLTNARLIPLLLSLSTDHRQVLIDYPRQMNQYQHVAMSLINLGIYYPYMKGSLDAMDRGWYRLGQHARREIYPDGSLAECSPNYGMGILSHLKQAYLLAQETGYDDIGILEERLRAGLAYMALVADPLLRSPRIAKGGGELTESFAKMVEVVDVPEVQARLKGTREAMDGIPECVAYPWAGHVSMRSDWGQDATWLFFEPGPRGSGHADNAQLGIQLMAKGEWLLIDPGFYTYSGSEAEAPFSNYMKTSQAHNLVTVDGFGQRPTAEGKPKSANTQPGDYGWRDTDTFSEASALTHLDLGMRQSSTPGRCGI